MASLLEEMRRAKQRRESATVGLLVDEPLVSSETSGDASATPAPVAEAPASVEDTPTTKFTDAFAAARRAGAKTFEWEGNEYTTQLKEEVAPEVAAPAKPPVESRAAVRPNDVAAALQNPNAKPAPDFSRERIIDDFKTPTQKAADAAAAVPVPSLDQGFGRASRQLRKAQDQAAGKGYRARREREIHQQIPEADDTTVRNMVVEELLSGRQKTPAVIEDQDKADAHAAAAAPSAVATLGENLATGTAALGQSLMLIPETLQTGVDAAKDLADNAGRQIGLPEWMLKREFVGLDDLVTKPLARGVDIGEHHFAGFNDIATVYKNLGEMAKTPEGQVESQRIKLLADRAQQNALKGDFRDLVTLVSDPNAWAVVEGQALPFLAATFATKGKIGPLMAIEAGAAEAELQQFEARTGTKVDNVPAAAAILQRSMINGALERLGFQALVGKLPDQVLDVLAGYAGKNLVTKLATRTGRAVTGILGEGGTEALQKVNENLAVKANYDPTQRVAEDVLLEGMGGAAGGAAFTAPGALGGVIGDVVQSMRPAAPIVPHIGDTGEQKADATTDAVIDAALQEKAAQETAAEETAIGQLIADNLQQVGAPVEPTLAADAQAPVDPSGRIEPTLATDATSVPADPAGRIEPTTEADAGVPAVQETPPFTKPEPAQNLNTETAPPIPETGTQPPAPPSVAEQVDMVAHDAATSPLNDLPQPTEAQKKAGTYRKGHLSLHGLDLAIENPRGSERSGTDPDGAAWSVTMPHHYGYIKRTTGADGDQVDAYLGPNPESQQVFVVDQVNPDTGAFDEHKVLLGFNSQEEATRGYAAGFSDGRGGERAGAVTPMDVPQFKAWLKHGNTTLPLSDTVQATAPVVASSTAQPSGETDARQDNPHQQVLDNIAAGYAAAAARPGASARVQETAARIASVTVVDPATLPDDGASGSLGRDDLDVLNQLGALTGTTYVPVHAPDMGAEQFVIPGVGRTVYVDASAPLRVDPVATAGHETFHIAMHTLRASQDAVDQDIAAVLDETMALNLTGDGLARYRAYYGDTTLPDASLREEAAADIAGNLHTDPVFWGRVLDAIEAKHGNVGVRKLVNALRDAYAKLVNVVKGRRFEEGYVRNAERVREAVAQALIQYYVNHGDAAAMATTKANLALKMSPKRPTSDIGHKRHGTDGRYVGAPDWVDNSPQKLAALRAKLRQLTAEGAVGRYWYENSSRAVLDLVGGDKAEAEKFVGLLAIFSQGTEVGANTTFALEAYYQWKAGLPIKSGRFPTQQSAKAENWLRGAGDWSGIKTNNFYSDLMTEIDPSKVDAEHSTMDMWMALAFDYGSDKLDQGPKYLFAQREIKRLAEAMGWEPHQAQAAVWTAIKARVESTEQKRNKIEVARGIRAKGGTVKGREYDHFRLAHKLGMAADITPAQIADTNFDFAHALEERSVQMSWEATPSEASGVLPGIHDAPIAQKFEYLAAIGKVLHDKKGRDLIADLVGMPQGISLTGVSAWGGKVGAGAQDVYPVHVTGAGKDRAVTELSRERLNLYAAVKGYVLSQQAVVWHLPVFTDAKVRHNGFQLETTRPLTEAEMNQVYQAIIARFGTTALAPGWRPDGFRVLNYVDGLDNDAFQKGMEAVIASLPEGLGGGSLGHKGFRADGDYVGNDWSEDRNGEKYTDRINARGPDLLGRADRLRALVAEVNARFAKRYGWGDVKRSARRPESTGDGGGRDQGWGAAPLEGAPQTRGAAGPDPRLVAVAERYARDNGIPLARQAEYAQVDEARARRIADAYAAMPHAPQDPQVKEAYQNLIRQTTAQYQALADAGYRFWFIDPDIPDNAEYLASPWNAMRDIRANQSMGVFPTEGGFGSDAAFDTSDNPLEQETGFEWPVGNPDGTTTKRVLANDLFRAVHDAFGHGLEGAGFRARGEENAWQAHVRLFTGSAVAAITSETRGQNSWLNYGPHGAANQTAPVEDTVFADQKTGLMPEWTWTEGRVGDMHNPDIRRSARRQDYHWNKVLKAKAGPVYQGQGFILDPVRPVPFETDFEAGGMADLGVMGHAAHVTEGATPTLYAILGDRGEKLGHVLADVRGVQIVAIHDIEVYTKRTEIGTQVVAAIVANSTEPVRVIEALDQSKGFWDKFGADYYDQYHNANIDWQGAKRFLDTRAPGAARRDAGAYADAGSPGVAGIEVADLDPVIAAGIKFSPARSDAAGRGSSGAGAAGTDRQHAVQVTGVHYSQQPRDLLDSSEHGTGIASAERARLADWSATREQRQRIYFYVDEGHGIVPEVGVGPHAHVVDIGNLYDARKDPLNLLQAARAKSPAPNLVGNYFEQELMAAGFDGPYYSDAGDGQGVAILLGERKIEIKRSTPRQTPSFSADVPNEHWLSEQIDYAKTRPRSRYGVPYMGKITGSFRGKPMAPVADLQRLKGERGEQSAVRADDLAWLVNEMRQNGVENVGAPYIEVGYDGVPWVSEGNHRIMAAAELGWEVMPVEIRYFDGGERTAQGAFAPDLLLSPDIRRSTPREPKTPEQLRQDYARLVGQDDPAAVSFVDRAMEAAEADWEAAKRGTVSHEASDEAAKRLAHRLGWSTEAVAAALQQGSVDVNGRAVPAAELLGAGAATARLSVAQLLANPDGADFSQRMASTINLMIATRANLSEIGRALSFAGWLERKPGVSAQQRTERALKSLDEATLAADQAVGVTANMSEDEKALVAGYNAAMRDLGDARMATEEITEEVAQAQQDLLDVRDQVRDARSARDAAKKRLSEANAGLKKAEQQRANAVDRTPGAFAITQAEGAARRAANEAQAAKDAERIAKERMKAAADRLARAQEQLQTARDNAVDPAELKRMEQKARMAEAEANLAASALKEAERKLREAARRLKEAQAKEADAKAKTPTAFDISQAQGAARRAEQAADKATADLRAAQRELAKLRAKLQAAVKRQVQQEQRLAGVQQRVAAMRKPQFVGKGGVTMAEIEAAVGGVKGMQRIQRAMRAQGANLDLDQVAQFFQGVANAIYTKKLEATKHRGTVGALHNLMAAWLEQFRAFILTGIFTHGVNIISNAAFQAVEMGITRPIAAALPGGAGVVNHYRALTTALVRSVADVYAVLRFGMTQEFPAAHFEALATARPATRQDLLDLGGNKWMDQHGGALPGLYGKAVRSVGFSPLGAMDLLFKIVPYRYAIAVQQAQGVPVDYGRAVEMAEYQTFQTALSEGMSGIQRFVGAHPMLGFIVPFIKTLVNLINRTLDYTPVLGQVVNRDNLLGYHGADARNVALAQAVVGAGLALVTLALHGDGDDDDESRLSGMGPLDYNKQALWAANHEKLGLRAGDVVIPLWRLEPFASMMGLTTAARDAYALGGDTGDWQAAARTLGAALGQVVVGKSFMKGAEEAMQAALDIEGRGWKYVTERLPQSMVLGSTIPNFIPQLGDMTDRYKRDAEGWSQQVRRRVPGWRETLDPKLDYAGRPILEPRYGTALPLQAMPVKDDLVSAWALRNDVPLEAMPRSLKTDDKTGKRLPFSERERLLKMRALEMSLAAQSSGVGKPEKPGPETPEQKAARLALQKMLKKDARDEASSVKRDWADEVTYSRGVYGLDNPDE